MAFRKELTELKSLWRQTLFGSDRPSDGAVLVSEIKVKPDAAEYGPNILKQYARTLKVMAKAVEQPITYSGGASEQYTVFSRQKRLTDISQEAIPLPGSQQGELCIVVPDAVWEGFKYYSIFIDALCIHEWSLFTENATQYVEGVSRGSVYQALTDRPDNRRPLTWERNQIDLLFLQGQEINCFWTDRKLSIENYNVDHIIPVSTYPINELWNLVPSEPNYNKHVKRALMPADDWRDILPQRLTETYGLYEKAASLRQALGRSARLRFTAEQMSSVPKLADTVTSMIYSVADSKNTPRFKRPH